MDEAGVLYCMELDTIVEGMWGQGTRNKVGEERRNMQKEYRAASG